jgi:hypothetical protein
MLWAVALAASIAACGGGGSSSGGTPYQPPRATTPAPPPGPVVSPSTQQVVTMAEPDTAIGTIVDPNFNVLVGGYTRQSYSQVLGFAPGSQIMLRNGQSAVPHTLSVLSSTGFVGTPSATAAGGSTIGTGFATGVVNGGALIGPFTLTAGTYFVACAFHYVSENMRTVLVVAANATPGPQATPPAAATAPPGGIGY